MSKNALSLYSKLKTISTDEVWSVDEVADNIREFVSEKTVQPSDLVFDPHGHIKFKMNFVKSCSRISFVDLLKQIVLKKDLINVWGRAEVQTQEGKLFGIQEKFFHIPAKVLYFCNFEEEIQLNSIYNLTLDEVNLIDQIYTAIVKKFENMDYDGLGKYAEACRINFFGELTKVGDEVTLYFHHNEIQFTLNAKDLFENVDRILTNDFQIVEVEKGKLKLVI